MNHNYKGEAQQVYDENKLRLRLESRILMGRLNNEVLREMTNEFHEALLKGEILTLGSSRAEIQAYIIAAVQKQLNA
jgi:hypothetical protein